MDLTSFDFHLNDNIQVIFNDHNENYNLLVKENESDIEKIWEEQQVAKNQKFFNGKILNLSQINQDSKRLSIQCHPIEYKHFLAQKNGVDLAIKPLAVSGISYIVKDGVKRFMLGKRSKSVTSYPECFEFIPSGSIDVENFVSGQKINFIPQIIKEFVEETSFNKTSIKSANPFCVIYDDLDEVFDVGIEIKLEEKLLDIDEVDFSDEYSKIKFFELNEIEELFDQSEVVKTSNKLFEAYRAFKGGSL